MSTVQAAHPTNKVMLAVFWLYVLAPLAWGVFNTLSQAMKLFH
ncbi:oxalate:formate antiporter [Paraburkholderia sp. D15]|nr:oxalate:formate antiporter [Paraburkholderia sp. D15]WGS53996.1 oxalate:formate antiporter [Paraburkholderia sp. D15]